MNQLICKKTVFLTIVAIILCNASLTLAATPAYWSDFKGMSGEGFVSYDGTPPFVWDPSGTPSDTDFRFDLRMLSQSGRQGIFNMECTQYTPNGVVKYRADNARITIRECIYDEPYIFYLFGPPDSAYLQIRVTENIEVQRDYGPWIDSTGVTVKCGSWFGKNVFRVDPGYSDILEDNINPEFKVDQGWISAEYVKSNTESFGEDFESGVLDMWQVIYSANGQFPSVTIDPLDAANHVAYIGSGNISMGPLPYASIYKNIAVANRVNSTPYLHLKYLVSDNITGVEDSIWIKVNNVDMEIGEPSGGLWQDLRYDLVAYEGQTITLLIGFMSLDDDTMDANYFVDDVYVSYE